MRVAVLAFALSVIVRSVFAEGGASVICLPNGDVEIENVGSAAAAARTVVELNTNVDFRVVCQVYYQDNMNPSPMEAEEIEETDQIVNKLLATYLSVEFWGSEPDELVEAYRSGTVFERLNDFPRWMDDTLNAFAMTFEAKGMAKPDLSVVAVSMKAVGEFAERVSE